MKYKIVELLFILELISLAYNKFQEWNRRIEFLKLQLFQNLFYYILSLNIVLLDNYFNGDTIFVRI